MPTDTGDGSGAGRMEIGEIRPRPLHEQGTLDTGVVERNDVLVDLARSYMFEGLTHDQPRPLAASSPSRSLTRLKRRYDPDNRFRRNQNVRPAP
jgi:hypothetical protein